MQLPPPTSGNVLFDGTDLTTLQGRATLRAPAPAHADDLPGPDLVAEPAPPGRRHRRRGARHLEHRRQGSRARRRSTRCSTPSASTPTSAGDRRPHEFSGGQCQRISIARAVVTEPKLIICDEPVSALDVSVQAQILNLLEDMKPRYGLTLIFIAHDLAVVKNVSDRVAVMYLGKLCEVAPPDELYAQPAHPYTAALLARDPRARPRRRGPTRARSLGGEIPSPLNPAVRLPVPHPLPQGARSAAPRRSRRSASSRPATSWRATSRSSRASTSSSPTPTDAQARISSADGPHRGSCR